MVDHAAGHEVDVLWWCKGWMSRSAGDAVKDELAPWRSEVVAGSKRARMRAGTGRVCAHTMQ